MTHMWKSEEVYTFDMPSQRINDVYGKNARFPLLQWLKFHNPKVSDMRFDAHLPGLHVIVGVPKYPGSSPHFKPGDSCYPYFNEQDQAKLLKTYMDYANMSHEETQAWYTAQCNTRRQEDE